MSVFEFAVKFFQEAWHALSQAHLIAESELVLTLLALVDIVLVGGLIVMVMLSGYENFVSRIDVNRGDNREAALGWLGKLDAGGLKLKVAASIVAISSIHLLRIFMNAMQVPNDKIMWYVVLHLTFVVSAVLLAVMDRVTAAAKHA